MAQNSPAPLPPLPDARQLRWHSDAMNAFIHFGPNTFTGVEWGSGQEKAEAFNPTKLDARQWVKAFKSAGFAGVVITAKHHDGFCLWPTAQSKHSVASSTWKQGKGDVLKELADACREAGLRFGVYLSPWDRNHPTYGTDAYNDTFVAMLEEVLTRYGSVFEVWFDGACGEGPNGKRQVYDWKRYVATVRKHAPDAVIFSDAGPDIRWVGNERGHAAETSWCLLDRDRFVPGTDLAAELTEGHMNGTHWVPSECDVSIRPGWFWRASETQKVKSGMALLDLYERSVGWNANFLLNVPPNVDGLIDDADVAALDDFGRRVRHTYQKNLIEGALCVASSSFGDGTAHPAARLTDGDSSTYWAAASDAKSASIVVVAKAPLTFDRIRLVEPIALGQRTRSFTIEAKSATGWEVLGTGTTIGASRIVRTKPTTASEIRVTITESKGTVLLASISAHRSPPLILPR